jgi:hypothetical protein
MRAGGGGGVIYSYSMIKGEDGRQPRGNKQSLSCISFYKQSLSFCKQSLSLVSARTQTKLFHELSL